MGNEWFCLVLGQEFGPLSLPDLARMADDGQLVATDIVRDGANGEWQAAGQVETLWPLDFSVCPNEASDAAPSGRRWRTAIAASFAALAAAAVSGWSLWPRPGYQVAVAPASAPNALSTPPPTKPAPPPPNDPAPVEPPEVGEATGDDDQRDGDVPHASGNGTQDDREAGPPPSEEAALAAEQGAMQDDAPAAPMAAKDTEPKHRHFGPEYPNDSASRPGIPEQVASQEPVDALNAGPPAPIDARLAQLSDIYKRRVALLLRRDLLRVDIKAAQTSAAKIDAELAGIATRSTLIVAQMSGAGGVIDLSLNQILQNELSGLNARGTALSADKVALNGQLAAYAESMAALMNEADALRAEWLALVDPFGVFARGDHERAIATFTEWIALDSENAGAFLARGFALWHLGRMDESLRDFDSAVDIEGPMLATSLAARGGARYAAGNQRGAMADFGKALKADKGECLIYLFRGRAYCAVKKFPLARNDFKTAAALNPKDAEVFKNWALLEAACPTPSFRNAKKAIEHAKAANELTQGKDWSAIAALAAAYAEARDFDAAVKYAREAGRLAWGEHLAECRRQIALYEKKEPLRLDWKELVRPPPRIAAQEPPAPKAPAPAP